MKIKSIKIKNFKSIDDLDLDFNSNNDGNMNIFIGKNGTGKTAVFEAINFVLGDRYPMPQSFQKEWFRDPKVESSISISFDKPEIPKGANQTFTFRVKIENEDVTGRLKNDVGTVVNNDVRSKYQVNFLGSNRSIQSIMPTNAWSLLGKHFYDATFFDEDTTKRFNSKMEEAMKILEDNERFQEFIKAVNEEFGSQIGRSDVKSKFELYDRLHFLKTLEFYNDQGVNLKNEGSGIQNSFIIACLRSLAKHRGTSSNPILIDEPELYLHPQAKKSLYKTLNDLSNNGVQIFYTTHSGEFLSFSKPEHIYLFKSPDCKLGTKVFRSEKVDTPSLLASLESKNDLNSAFFADSIIIVEGKDDKRVVTDIIIDKTGNIPEDFNITIINAGGKDQQHLVHSLYKNFEQEIVFIRDYDRSNNEPSYPEQLFQVLNIADDQGVKIDPTNLFDDTRDYEKQAKVFDNVLIFKDKIESFYGKDGKNKFKTLIENDDGGIIQEKYTEHNDIIYNFLAKKISSLRSESQIGLPDKYEIG